jgi:hypothetical protein
MARLNLFGLLASGGLLLDDISTAFLASTFCLAESRASVYLIDSALSSFSPPGSK